MMSDVKIGRDAPRDGRNNRALARIAILGLALSGIYYAVASMALAQPNDTTATPPLVTDRPTDSASPVLVPRRAFQLELGYKFSRVDTGSTHTYNRLFPDLLARYGVNHKVEARLVASGWSFENGDAEGSDGFSDISLGTKIALAEERGRRPQISLLVDVSLPTGQSGVTNDYVIRRSCSWAPTLCRIGLD